MMVPPRFRRGGFLKYTDATQRYAEVDVADEGHTIITAHVGIEKSLQRGDLVWVLSESDRSLRWVIVAAQHSAS